MCQVYEGLSFKLSLKFPTSYPYESPQVTFITPCFHPNVDQYGNICLDILKVCDTPQLVLFLYTEVERALFMMPRCLSTTLLCDDLAC